MRQGNIMRKNLRNKSYVKLLLCRCTLSDWRVQLAHILQPLPFPEAAIQSVFFADQLSIAIGQIGSDKRCEV